MRQFGVLTALALTWITASCAERIVPPAVQIEPPAQIAASKQRPANVEPRRQAEKIAEGTRNFSAISPRQVTPSANVRPVPPSEPQAQLLQGSQQPKETPTSREPPAVVALPPPPEPVEPNFPVAVLMPPPTSTLPEVSPKAAMPPPPDPAEPNFPVATLMPPLPEPAEPSLPPPLEEQIAAESPTPIPFPDLPSYVSLRPRFDWVDTVGAIDLPLNPLSEALEASPEKRSPSLIQNPWPLSTDGT
jgi:hypothetical protein